ncbi:MAG TPA: site-specific integrase [Gaiellaceae bacterium]|nr:site-specific integrase [Gaiellaceae bacterium]
MASVSIRRRQTKSGSRFQVRYRLGGRTYPLVHGGSFLTMKEARLRRDLVAGELAVGRNPAETLRALVETPQRRTFADLYDAFTASRVDVAETTKINYGTHRIRLVDLLGDRDPQTIGWQDVQGVVSSLADDLAPLSVRNYLGTLRIVLDFADLDPNPARDRRVKLPRPEESLPNPPTSAEVETIIVNAARRWRLAIRVLEQTGMRVGELVACEWGDVDRANLRLRIRTGKTAAARRWVPVPEWLIEEIEETCPPDDRTALRRVFPGAGRQTIGNAMRNACKTAGIASYSPHDLRHRFISVKIREGIPVTEIAAHVGHSRKSLTLDTYAHVLIDE